MLTKDIIEWHPFSISIKDLKHRLQIDTIKSICTFEKQDKILEKVNFTRMDGENLGVNDYVANIFDHRKVYDGTQVLLMNISISAKYTDSFDAAD